MAVCSNCGAELEEGQKFCYECGTPVPQSKKCIKCGAELALKMKFCPECGTRQDGEEKAVGSSGFTMGNENVIAGDVIGHKEETNIAGNATIIKNEDQTKQVKKCHICGSLVAITQGFECPECGQFTCANCYDEELGACSSCAEQKSKDNIEQYKNALKEALADGRIELSERQALDALQKKLKIPYDLARKLENEMKNAGAEEKSLTIFEERIFNEAKACFYDKADETKALELLEPVYQNHRHDEKILDLYLPILAEADAEKALEITGSLEIDILSAYIAEISIAVKNENFDKAEIKIKQAMRMWPENALVDSWRVAFYYAMYKQFSDKSFLEKAKEIADSLDEAQNEVELSYAVKMKARLAEEAGEEALGFSREFCRENNLYWQIMQSDLGKIDYIKGNEVADYIASLKPGSYEINVKGEIDDDSFEKIKKVLQNDKLKIKLKLKETVITEIKESAFERCSGLTEIIIPYSATKIGESAFEGCSGLTQITIPDSVTEILDGAFNNCSRLTQITIPDGVTKIHSCVFEDCSGLTQITIPDGVTKIGTFAFEHCSGLAQITIPDGVTEIGTFAFEHCSGLAQITIPDGVTEIGDFAFAYCSGLTQVTIPDSVTEILDGAFNNCSGLTQITIPNSVTKIHSCVFEDCSRLTQVTIPDSVTEILAGAFNNCSGLTQITIPDSVTLIGPDSFKGCRRLTQITIPDSVTKIWDGAFISCTALKTAYVPKNLNVDGVFEGNTKIIRK